MTDATAQQIVHELYPSSWNDFIIRCPIEDLQAMARLWLLRVEILDALAEAHAMTWADKEDENAQLADRFDDLWAKIKEIG